MFARIPAVFVLFSIFLSAGPSAAQWTEAKKEQLLQLSDQAKEAIGQQAFPAPAERAAVVASAADKVAIYLRQRAGNERADAWLRYLAFDPLVQAIREDRPVAEIQTHARELQGRLIGTAPGLELPPLVELRAATDQLLQAARYGTPEQSKTWVSTQLAALDRQLNTGDPAKVPNDAAALSLLAQYLDHSGQADDLAQTLASEFSQPNLVVAVGSQAVQDWISRSVDRSQVIRDCILGTRVQGQGRMTGQLTGRLAHGTGCVAIELVLTGQFASQTVGYNRSVQLPTVGHGRVNISRRLVINEQSVALSPVADAVSLQTQVTSIQHPMRLVRRIAAKQVAQKHPQSEAIARQRFRTQVVGDFTQQTQQAVDSMDRSGDRMNQARQVMTRLNWEQPVRSLSSNPEAIRLQVTQRNGKQLAAIMPAASWVAPAAGVGVQMHESFVDNLASPVLAGRTMTNKQIDRLLSDLGRAAPTAGDDGETADEDFAIQFATFRPIICEMRDGQLKIGLRGSRFYRDGTNVLGAVEITFAYRPVIREDGSVMLERIGDVGVDFPGKTSLTISEVAERRAVQRIFQRRVPDTLLDKTLRLPSTIAVPALAGRQVRVTDFQANDGWLAMGLVPR